MIYKPNWLWTSPNVTHISDACTRVLVKHSNHAKASEHLKS